MRKRFSLSLVLLSLCCFGLAGVAQGQQASHDNARKLVRKVEPQYPAAAKRTNLGGTVKVIAEVAPDGSVKRVEPVGGSPLLLQAAENAVLQWKFVPGAESKETVELRFTP